MTLSRRAIALSIALLASLPTTAATFIVTTAADSGPGSLRQAILDANASPGPHVIEGAMVGGVQQPLSALPALTADDTEIRGFIIDGSSAGAGANGLAINANRVVLTSLGVSAFSGDGIRISASTAVQVLASSVYGNDGWGIHIIDSTAAVAGTAPQETAEVYGNSAGGILVESSAVAISYTFIGTDSTGLTDFGNGGPGVMYVNSTGGLGGTPGIYNVISGNGGDGVVLENSNGVEIAAQRIGVGVDGTTPIGNSGHGLVIRSSGVQFINPGLVAQNRNIIAHNGGAGILVPNSGAYVGNRLGGMNSIHSNGLLGISLTAGTTPLPNDNLDADLGGGNNGQNHPVLGAAAFAGTTVTAWGTLHSTPSRTFQLDFFRNAACDASGFGEGETYLGSTNVTTDVTGNVTFLHPLTSTGTGFVTAIATDLTTGDTSEFSPCAAIAPAGTVQFSSATYSVDEEAGTITITVTRTGGDAGPATVTYTTFPGTATAADFTPVTGVVTWGSNATGPRTFTIPIINDNLTEGAEQFTVQLSGATVATLGSPATATVTIDPSDAPGAATDIPTASEWALIVIAGLLALAALRRL